MLPSLEPSRLVCASCGKEVTVLRVGDSAHTQVMPCGHTQGYWSVPASTLEPDAAA